MQSNTAEYAKSYITILENNFRYKKMPFKEVFDMVSDLNEILSEYFLENPEDCSVIAREKYFKIIKTMIDLDKTKENRAIYQQYMKNAFRMSSYSSLHHYMIYREWLDNDKFYLPRLPIMSGYIHYLQELSNKKSKLRLLICNMPSGYGKTYPEKISEAWSFGRDPTTTVLSLCSNEDVVLGGSNTVRNEMKSEEFGEVFNKMKWDADDKTYFTKETDKVWKLRDCRLGNSYYASTTQSNVVGIRASQRIHIDDLYADYKEAMNVSTNLLYYNKFLTVWRKRFVQSEEPRVCVTGTLWASGDFIAQLIDLEEKMHTFKPDSHYKYVKVSEDESVVIIQVPALDYETGLSSCPELKTTQEILREKEEIEEYLFETNFQQRPTDPEELEFSYKRLRTYESYPKSNGVAFAVIDATRKSGKDYFAMPIHLKMMNEDSIPDYPLIDCIFTKTATKDLYNEIVDKIIEHHIILLIIESNVTSELKKNIEDLLEEKGAFFCEIREKYNNIPKETRIEMEKSTIKKRIVYPEKKLFAPSSQMADFMNNLTLFSAVSRTKNDDAPDAESMFASEIIEEASKPERVTVFKRPF